jgi:quercetin dioxygenase-like cupin family protein
LPDEEINSHFDKIVEWRYDFDKYKQFSTEINKMEQILLQHFSAMEWLPHPTLPAIATRFSPITLVGHPAVDTLIARLEPGGVIPRHTHPETCEITYVLSAFGLLVEGEEGAETVRPLTEGSALFIPAGVPHRIENTSSQMMHIFAVHTRKVEANHA